MSNSCGNRSHIRNASCDVNGGLLKAEQKKRRTTLTIGSSSYSFFNSFLKFFLVPATDGFLNGHKEEGRDRRGCQTSAGRRSQVSRLRSETGVNMESHKNPGRRSQIPR